MTERAENTVTMIWAEDAVGCALNYAFYWDWDADTTFRFLRQISMYANSAAEAVQAGVGTMSDPQRIVDTPERRIERLVNQATKDHTEIVSLRDRLGRAQDLITERIVSGYTSHHGDESEFVHELLFILQGAYGE